MRIFLVRHGESKANVDKALYKIVPDHEIALTSEGMEQAQRAGHVLLDYINNNPLSIANPVDNLMSGVMDMMRKISEGKLDDLEPATQFKARLWQSPYRRTRETARIISGVAKDVILDVREHALLCEQQFGLFDGLTREESKEQFPPEYASFEHTKQYNGKFWARFPMGESPFDTACRIHQAFGTFHRDAEEHNINDIIIICHGTVLKLFTMMWLHKTPEWFQKEETCGNCAIRLLEDSEDRGFIFNGFKDGKVT